MGRKQKRPSLIVMTKRRREEIELAMIKMKIAGKHPDGAVCLCVKPFGFITRYCEVCHYAKCGRIVWRVGGGYSRTCEVTGEVKWQGVKP